MATCSDFEFGVSVKGQTGFPWIDAIMAQLREEGWIHHLARHAVACFLTRGDLWISWEDGTTRAKKKENCATALHWRSAVTACSRDPSRGLFGLDRDASV